MTSLKVLFLFTLLLSLTIFGRDGVGVASCQTMPNPALDVKVDHFDIADAILRDGLSELSLKNIEGLHLGFEEIIRDRISDDPRSLSPHFSLHLEGKTVRQIIEALCEKDTRYTWSEDGASINIYPRSIQNNRFYLLNLHIERVAVNEIPDPDQALTALSKLFPEQQVGYFGPGMGDNSYARPWTAAFEHLTVRQFIDRIAEHIGAQTSWVWEGGEQERMFTFVKGGFNSARPNPQPGKKPGYGGN